MSFLNLKPCFFSPLQPCDHGESTPGSWVVFSHCALMRAASLRKFPGIATWMVRLQVPCFRPSNPGVVSIACLQHWPLQGNCIPWLTFILLNALDSLSIRTGTWLACLKACYFFSNLWSWLFNQLQNSKSMWNPWLSNQIPKAVGWGFSERDPSPNAFQRDHWSECLWVGAARGTRRQRGVFTAK